MTHSVVIGAGIVGACTALALLREGHRVTILEPGPPGGEQAASYGNGCWLSPMSVIPPAVPGTWKKVPGFLADPLGPLAIRWSYLPKALPWLVRYLAAGWTEGRVLRTAQALRALLVDAPALHAELATAAGVGGLIERRGLMYVYPDRAAFEAEAMAWRVRAAVGIRWLELGPEDLHQREPALDRRYGFAALVEEALRERLGRKPVKAGGARQALPTFGRGGLQPGVALDDTASLLDLMDGDASPRR